ncbi:hypothetical protein SCLCIDRAFT_31847 [Scleroderma citrinum Foug A]|uniref:Uncharacterized protein n=1 Tax=Scleroderma citrinum Foug A TaxID=1036808 RepID=A0A0C3DBL7_9AGAM|nr:hypothetical protein SCLCIDRAFT_31847 [Scleroderma citrinum Foug A]
MRLINVKAFLEREEVIRKRKRVDRRVEVLELGNDEATEYAILSHRWIAQEVDYGEMVELTKMDRKERDKIRQRDGNRKIHQSCEQAQANGHEWLWVDTCCIDKRSSAELSEPIKSMYRWYEKAKICYAYLHDVPGSSFPTASDKERYPDFNAPSEVEFFNKDWQSIGKKTTLTPTLQNITGIPERILTHGNRPCIAQIMSWAANRTTMRIEDRVYSLMGPLDVNMPMLYGEGKKAFHRLQLEIIRASNDQSIFAWECKGWRGNFNGRSTSILADGPRFFEGCSEMELMSHGEFVQYIKTDGQEEELHSLEDRLGTFPITNRGIQIWLFLRPHLDSPSRLHFQAWLPCRGGRLDPPIAGHWTISSVPLQLRQVYLRYQHPPHRNITFKIDDSALAENGFTFCHMYPEKFTGDTLTLTGIDPLCIKVYSDSHANHPIAVGLGQCFGMHWIHVQPDLIPGLSWERYSQQEYTDMLVRAPEHIQDMNKARSGAERSDQVCIMQTRLPQTTRILQISSVMWKSSRMRGVRLDVFHGHSLDDVSGEWSAIDVDGTDSPGCDWRGLMILDRQRKYGSYKMGRALDNFLAAPYGIELGDYGQFTDAKEFCREGNLLKSLPDIITRQQHEMDLSLPSNDDLKSVLTSLSTVLTDRYLVTKIIQCPPDPLQPGSNITTPLYSVAKPFVWYRNESASSVPEEPSGDKLRGETQADQARANDVDEMKS